MYKIDETKDQEKYVLSRHFKYWPDDRGSSKWKIRSEQDEAADADRRGWSGGLYLVFSMGIC